ncbi:NfeD-like family protein 1 [Bordetella genomosp. 9]|uniref:NfeD family protein n=1 Tax=Bordetella genomosp. 9 TaxID=1416803 RepID=UPI000A296E83|nr:NfeD family protein [Bordetella genomosp. 9]ARP90874.1 NfeD-like family protein 1 [Bordetella genomosp. 9]
MWIWFGLAVLALIGELATGTFYLLLVATGLAAGGLAAAIDVGVEGQLAMCGVVVVAGLLILRATGILKKREVNPFRNADVNLDIGQTVTVADWKGSRSARVWYRGASWDAVLASDCEPVAGEQVITEVRGSQLVVRPRQSVSTHPIRG